MNDDLFRAIETSDFESLRRFLAIQGGIDATVAVPLSDNSPHNRTESHHTPMVVTPLMVACKLANRDAVRILVSSNCNVNKTTSINGAPRALYKRSFSHPDFWATPLILASAAGHRDIVEVLLKSRASPDKTSIINHRLEAVSPLFVACSGRTGDVAMKQRTDSSFFDPGTVDASSAIRSGRERRSNFHIVDLLLRYGARVNVFCCGLAPIHVACRVGDAEVVAALIRNGSSVNCKDDEFGCTPLHEASKMGWVGTVKVLLASGANVDALSSTQNAEFARAYQSLLPRLPINGTHVIRCGVSALTLAVAGRHWDAMDALLEHESNPNVPDTHGRVPLHFLCGGGRRLSGGGSVPENSRAAEEEEAELRAFHQLRRAGADLERRDHNGFKGMHYAAATNRARLLEVWVAQLGRHVVNRGSSKETCLHVACAFGAADALSVLLESGKFIQAYNDDGLLPFHLACAHGHCRVVEVLLRRGICPYDIPTLNGENGIWLAQSNGHLDTVSFLERWARGDRSQSHDQNRNQIGSSRKSVTLAPTTESSSRPSNTPQNSKGHSARRHEESTQQKGSDDDAHSTSLEFLSEERRPGLISGTSSSSSSLEQPTIAGPAPQEDGGQSRELLRQQVEMERAALGELKSVRDAAAQRIELWKQFCQVYDQLNAQK